MAHCMPTTRRRREAVRGVRSAACDCSWLFLMMLTLACPRARRFRRRSSSSASARRRRRARALSEGPRVLPAARQVDRSREVRGARQDDDGEFVCAAEDQLAAESGAVRSARRDQPAARRSARRCRTRRRRSWRPRASRSICSTRRFTRPRSRTARRSSTSSIASPPRTRRRFARFSTTRSCCWCRRRIPTASTSSSITGTRRRARSSTASIPDLYHKYVGHDDNRDWFMFTQKETRMNIELVQNKFKPIITHDMHQQGAGGSRIFVPPFTDPFDVNIHPMLAARTGDGRSGDGDGAARGRQGRRRVARGATTCGRRRGST